MIRLLAQGRALVCVAVLGLSACSLVSAPNDAADSSAAVEPQAPALPTAPGDAPSANDIDGAQVAALALAQLGAPYSFGGVTPSGFDCSGLVRFVFQQLGVAVPRTTAEQALASRPVPLDQLQPGDLVFFKIADTRIDHVGIYVGDGAFVHAPRTGRPVSRELLGESYYLRRYAGAGRFAP